jgi:hypothetical protein
VCKSSTTSVFAIRRSNRPVGRNVRPPKASHSFHRTAWTAWVNRKVAFRQIRSACTLLSEFRCETNGGGDSSVRQLQGISDKHLHSEEGIPSTSRTKLVADGVRTPRLREILYRCQFRRAGAPACPVSCLTGDSAFALGTLPFPLLYSNTGTEGSVTTTKPDVF